MSLWWEWLGLLTRILREGAVIAISGVAAGVIGGIVLSRTVAVYIPDVQVPDSLSLFGAAIVLVVAALFASFLPALRASRLDVVQVLRSAR